MFLFLLSELSYNIEVISFSSCFCIVFVLVVFFFSVKVSVFESTVKILGKNVNIPPNLICAVWREGCKASWMNCSGLMLVSFKRVLHLWSSQPFWGNSSIWNQSYQNQDRLVSVWTWIQCCVSSYNLLFRCCFTNNKFLNYQNKEMNNIFYIWLSLAVQLLPHSHWCAGRLSWAVQGRVIRDVCLCKPGCGLGSSAVVMRRPCAQFLLPLMGIMNIKWD